MTRYAVARLNRPTGHFYEVHAAGCRDLRTRGKYDPELTEVRTFGSLDGVARFVYPPDQFAYDPADPEEMAGYTADFRVHACAASLPEHDPTPPPLVGDAVMTLTPAELETLALDTGHPWPAIDTEHDPEGNDR